MMFFVFAACSSGGDSGTEPALKRVFVSSQIFTGALGGLSGANDKCQALATASGRTGTYMAWLSDTENSPSTTFTRSEDPYVLVNGTRIADDWTDLTTRGLRNPIVLDQNGIPGPFTSSPCGITNDWVHTATSRDGTANLIGGHCSNWTLPLGRGSWGRFTQVSFEWTAGCVNIVDLDDCAGRNALYCFEQ
jgi:hypothetical protein